MRKMAATVSSKSISEESTTVASSAQRRGSTCDLDERMLAELEKRLGKENVVVK